MMPWKESLLGDREVLRSEVIITRFDYDITIFPIDKVPQFKIIFHVDYDADKNTSFTEFGKKGDDEFTYSVVHSRGWMDGIVTGFIRTPPFAENNEVKLYLAFTVDIVGNKEKPAFRFSYTITQENIS